MNENNERFRFFGAMTRDEKLDEVLFLLRISCVGHKNRIGDSLCKYCGSMVEYPACICVECYNEVFDKE